MDGIAPAVFGLAVALNYAWEMAQAIQIPLLAPLIFWIAARWLNRPATEDP